MNRSLPPTLPLAAILGALLVTPSCQSVSKAPKGSPRVEVEVAIEADPAFTGALGADPKALITAMTDGIMSQADVGLRFYPVLSSSYGPKDRHPDLLMTISLKSLHVKLDERQVKKPDAPKDAEPETVIEPRDIESDVAARLERRRPDGPPLTVARADGSDRVAAAKPKEGDATWTVVHDQSAEHPVEVRQRDVDAAVHGALEHAFADMVKAIDRELSLMSDDGTHGNAPMDG